MSHHQLVNLVLSETKQWLGTPYMHQASNKQVGADCLGLIRGVWRALYKSEPEKIPFYSADWGQSNGHEEMLEAADKHFIKSSGVVKPGALIIFRWRHDAIAKHAGICSSPEKFIHAYERVGVVESTLGSHWRKKIVASFCFPTLQISRKN